MNESMALQLQHKIFIFINKCHLNGYAENIANFIACAMLKPCYVHEAMLHEAMPQGHNLFPNSYPRY